MHSTLQSAATFNRLGSILSGGFFWINSFYSLIDLELEGKRGSLDERGLDGDVAEVEF